MRRDIGSPEWVLMYRQGLATGHIAELFRVNVQQVNRAIARAERSNPGLVQEHLAKAPRTSAVTRRWKARCDELAAFIAANDRPPFTAGQAPEEASLGRWLERQRTAAAKGELDEDRRRALDAAGDWLTPARTLLEARRWRQRLQELAGFTSSRGRLPSRKAADDAERSIAIWLHTQRQQAERSDISAVHFQSLEDAVPGWNASGPRRSSL